MRYDIRVVVVIQASRGLMVISSKAMEFWRGDGVRWGAKKS